MIGIPLDGGGTFTGEFTDFLSPYALLSGGLTVAMLAMQGTLYLNLKSGEGELAGRIREWGWHSWGIFLVLYVLTTMYTLVAIPRATANFAHFPWAAAVVVLNVLAIANIPRALYRERFGQAFLSSCFTILAMVFLLSIALWPNLVTAVNAAENSLTVYNAASSQKTLWIMFLISLIGMPFVLFYTASVYWTFRGKVKVGEEVY